MRVTVDVIVLIVWVTVYGLASLLVGRWEGARRERKKLQRHLAINTTGQLTTMIFHCPPISVDTEANIRDALRRQGVNPILVPHGLKYRGRL